MRILLTILFICSLQNSFAQTPTSNAGADQTIYLTSTNQVTLNGTASTGTGLSYAWREVSTDYSSGATITNANTATATVSPLPQGVFYFELAVTDNVDRVSVDTMAVIVDYDAPPTNNKLVTRAIWADMAYGANLRDDTTTCYNWTSNIRSLVGNYPNQYYMEKDGTLGSRVDNMQQKYYSILNDGHGCSGYGRSEIIPNGAVDLVDTSKIYVIEWKGYFNQEMSGYATGAGEAIGVLMQCHGQDGNTPPFGFGLHGTDIQFSESSDGGNGSGQFDAGGNFKVKIFNTTELTKSCHTLRFTIREGKGYTGQKAFLKVEFDGVTKYYRNKGQVGATFMQDWLKGATFYDYNNLVTSATNYTRGKSVSLVTTAYRVYTVTDTVSTNSSVTASAGSNQTITLPTNSVSLSGSGTDSDGTIASYSWTKISGGTATITSPTSASTTITGLVAGTYVFQLQVTDNNGATATDTVQITVNAASITNYFITHGKTIYINK